MTICTEETTNSFLDPNVRRVIDAAKQEMRELIEERAYINRRIATTKAVIVGLAGVFGDASLQQELLEFMPGRGRATTSRPGLTRGCRLLLMAAKGPISSHKICEDLRLTDPGLASRHKHLLASITTVLSRLVSYGEAQVVEVNGRRSWEWIRAEETNSITTVDLPPQSE